MELGFSSFTLLCVRDFKTTLGCVWSLFCFMRLVRWISSHVHVFHSQWVVWSLTYEVFLSTPSPNRLVNCGEEETVSETGLQNRLRTCPNSGWGRGTFHSANLGRHAWVGRPLHLKSAPSFSCVPLNAAHWLCTITLTAGRKRCAGIYSFAIWANILKMYELAWSNNYLNIYWNRLGSSHFFKILVIVWVK